MAGEVSLDELWRSAPCGDAAFSSSDLVRLPEAARRYLEHAIAAGTKLASAVRIQMHGEIKLRDWLPFTAEEVIDWNRGFIWAAAVKMRGFSIQGSDRFLDGRGAMRWKLLGIIPVMTASGPQITRSAIGRLQGESVWLPSMLCGDQVRWTAEDEVHPRASLSVHSEAADVDLAIDDQGRIKTVKLARWGNPEGGDYRYVDFGVVAEEERTFSGYTIPSRIRAGWYFGTDRFDREGEFFRAEIDDAEYR